MTTPSSPLVGPRKIRSASRFAGLTCCVADFPIGTPSKPSGARQTWKLLGRNQLRSRGNDVARANSGGARASRPPCSASRRTHTTVRHEFYKAISDAPLRPRRPGADSGSPSPSRSAREGEGWGEVGSSIRSFPAAGLGGIFHTCIPANDRSTRSAGFLTCCVADFPIGTPSRSSDARAQQSIPLGNGVRQGAVAFPSPPRSGGEGRGEVARSIELSLQPRHPSADVVSPSPSRSAREGPRFAKRSSLVGEPSRGGLGKPLGWGEVGSSIRSFPAASITPPSGKAGA